MRDQRKEDKSLRTVPSGYEAGFMGMEGRGMYAGGTLAGVHVEVSERDGTSWGFEERLYYTMRNDGTDPNTGKPRKYVGLSIPSLGVFGDVVKYDHGNRNDNQADVMGKNRMQFEQIATEKGMNVGHYSAFGSSLHEPGGFWGFVKGRLMGLFSGNTPKQTVDKMWMQEGDKHWWQIPAVEGLFDKNTGKYYSAPSYNYGNNIISHIFWDIIPGWVMGYENDMYK